MPDQPSDQEDPTQMDLSTPVSKTGEARDLSAYSESVRGLAKDGILLKRYQLNRILGAGGMGVVWLAQDLDLKENIALKFLPQMVAHDAAALEELKVEVRRSRRLTHENIVRVHDYLQDGDWAAISMEYVEGKNLSTLRVQEPSHVFSIEKLAPLVQQICMALDYAHTEAKVVHHDLKPANFMVTTKWKLKVCDFGIARSLSESVTRLTTKERTSGTLIYMSPQHLMGENPSVLDDIYALGATIYELLTTKPPFYSGNIAAQVMEKTPPSMKQRRQDLGARTDPPVATPLEPIPQVWEEVVAACLAKETQKRPQTTREVSERLGLVMARSTLDAQRTSEIEKPYTVSGTGKTISSVISRQILRATVAALLLLLLVFATWHFSVHHPVEPEKVMQNKNVKMAENAVQAREKAGNKDMPLFQPGVSRVYGPKEILEHMNGEMADVWLSGKFIVSKGGPQNSSQCVCLEAGERTRRAFHTLLFHHDDSAMPIYSFGWYFNPSRFPKFNEVKVDSVLHISFDAPAKVIRTYRKNGHPTILCMLTKPPKIED